MRKYPIAWDAWVVILLIFSVGLFAGVVMEHYLGPKPQYEDCDVASPDENGVIRIPAHSCVALPVAEVEVQ